MARPPGSGRGSGPPIGRPPFGGPPPRPVTTTPQPGFASPHPGQSYLKSDFVGPPTTPEGVPPTDPKTLPADPRVVGAQAELTPTQLLAIAPNLPPSGVMQTSQASLFLHQMPARAMQLWHRAVAGLGSTLVNATVPGRLQVQKLPDNTALILLSVVQLWYDDSGASDVLVPRADEADAYGRVSFNFLVNGVPIWDASEQVIDPDGGANTNRTVSGYTKLNVNLLDVGHHSTALYARGGANISVGWNTYGVPASTPFSLSAVLDGYLVPVREFDEFLLKNRIY